MANTRNASARTAVAEPQQQQTVEMPQQSAAIQRAPKDDAQILREIQGATRNLDHVKARMQWATTHTHLVMPATIAPIPEGCSLAFTVLYIDPTDVETYAVEGKRGLSKVALDKIANAAGVSWDPNESKRTDDRRDPRYCSYKAVGHVRKLDGSVRTICDEKEMDLRDGSDQLKGKTDRQVAQMRQFIYAHTITKARLRAIRSLGVKTSYTEEELKKPFVVVSLTWTGESDDPELRRVFAEKQADAMLGGMRSLYGDQARLAPPAPSSEPQYPDANAVDPEADAIPESDPRASSSTTTEKKQGSPRTVAPAESGPVCKFGRSAGKLLAEIDDEDLLWYENAVMKSVTDPSKAKYLADNQAHLNEVRAEMELRAGIPGTANGGSDGKY